jgi:hypothetical protein
MGFALVRGVLIGDVGLRSLPVLGVSCRIAEVVVASLVAGQSSSSSGEGRS